jgi:hypothetical protein
MKRGPCFFDLQALGPVTDAGVAIKQKFGLFPSVRITANKDASSDASKSVSKSVSFMPSISVTSSPVSKSDSKSMHFKIGGRKLAQACDPNDKVRRMPCFQLAVALDASP